MVIKLIGNSDQLMQFHFAVTLVCWASCEPWTVPTPPYHLHLAPAN